jgi:hypothetical protein
VGLTWQVEGYGHYAMDGDRHVATVGIRTEGWEARYWGDIPGYGPGGYGTDKAVIGMFPSAELAVAAIEERHLGADACE